MARIVVLSHIEGGPVAVNADAVTFIKPHKPSGTWIGFGKDRGVTVSESFEATISALQPPV